jgi:transposase-like protein
MDFPILELCDDELGEAWVQKHFHPRGLKCPRCGKGVKRARRFGQTKRSTVTVYRCCECQTVYTVYSSTVFAHTHLRPAQVVLLLRGICKGESTAGLARELELSYDTVHHLRQRIQANAVKLQPDTPLPDPVPDPVTDPVTETDEMYQNAGEKGRKAC